MKKICSIILLLLCFFTLASCDINVDDLIKKIDSEDLFDDQEIEEEQDDSKAEEISNIYKIETAGEYKITGDVNDTIVVDAKKDDEITIFLENSTITSTTYACIYVLKAKKVYLSLIGDNTLTNTTSFVQTDDNTVDGVIFSKCDLSVIGTGSLTIASCSHGIVAKDNLVITNCLLNITSTKKGIDVNDSLSTMNTNITINAQTDGIHIENTDNAEVGDGYFKDSSISVSSLYDCISASHILEFEGGSFTCTTLTSYSISSSVSRKGLKAKSNIILCANEGTITSVDDAVHSNNDILVSSGTYTISTGDDAIHADSKLQIDGGSIKVTKSYEGLESTDIVINGGNISIVASDDGINAAGGNDSSGFGGGFGGNTFSSSSNACITITGGTIKINASGDGIDSNGSITMSGGNVLVYGPTDNGNGALDYDKSFTITGGILCAIGSSGMAQNVSAGTQGSILYNLSSSQKSGVTIKLTLNNNIIYEVESTKTFNSVVISTPDIVKGSTYKLIVGSSTYSITMSSLIYGTGSQGGPGGGGPGGGPGGGRW